MNLTNLLPTIAFTSLLLLMVSYWSQASFFGEERYKGLNSFLSLLSILSLTTLLIVRWIESGHFPLSNLYESLLFLSWCFLTVKALFDTKALVAPALTKQGLVTQVHTETFKKSFLYRAAFSKAGVERDLQLSNLGLGVVLSPLALLTSGFAFLSLPKEMQQATALVPALQSNWLMMHVTVMVLSYAALLSGSLLSIAFLILHRLEKPKDLFTEGNAPADKAVFCLAATSPSNQKEISNSSYNAELGTPGVKAGVTLHEEKRRDLLLSTRLDNYSYRILALGFPLLTIGILSGAVWANEAWGSYWSWDPKETWALITWLVFAIYLHTRITKGWSGEKPAIVASVGFFMVWFCYLGVNLLGTGLHSYGWFSN